MAEETLLAHHPGRDSDHRIATSNISASSPKAGPDAYIDMCTDSRVCYFSKSFASASHGPRKGGWVADAYTGGFSQLEGVIRTIFSDMEYPRKVHDNVLRLESMRNTLMQIRTELADTVVMARASNNRRCMARGLGSGSSVCFVLTSSSLRSRPVGYGLHPAANSQILKLLRWERHRICVRSTPNRHGVPYFVACCPHPYVPSCCLRKTPSR